MKSGKIQITFLLEPEVRERLKEFRFEQRKFSEGQIVREAIEFFFSELDQRNPRHPYVHQKSSTKARAA
jgi:predicted DNA-binding protein